MAILQNPPTQAQQLLPQQIQPLGLMAGPIRLSQWDNYGFTIPKSTIVGWIAKSRVNGIMREGAVMRFGQRYYVDPPELNAWMHRHSEGTRLTRGTARHRRDEDKDKGGEARIARGATDGGEQQAKRKTTHTGRRTPGAPSLTDAQVEEIRRRCADTPREDREARSKLYAQLATKLDRHWKVIADCAEDRTYRSLPLTETYQKSKGVRRGQTASQAAETTAG